MYDETTYKNIKKIAFHEQGNRSESSLLAGKYHDTLATD